MQNSRFSYEIQEIVKEANRQEKLRHYECSPSQTTLDDKDDENFDTLCSGFQIPIHSSMNESGKFMYDSNSQTYLNTDLHSQNGKQVKPSEWQAIKGI